MTEEQTFETKKLIAITQIIEGFEFLDRCMIEEQRMLTIKMKDKNEYLCIFLQERNELQSSDV